MPPSQNGDFQRAVLVIDEGLGERHPCCLVVHVTRCVLPGIRLHFCFSLFSSDLFLHLRIAFDFFALPRDGILADLHFLQVVGQLCGFDPAEPAEVVWFQLDEFGIVEELGIHAGDPSAHG